MVRQAIFEFEEHFESFAFYDVVVHSLPDLYSRAKGFCVVHNQMTADIKMGLAELEVEDYIIVEVRAVDEK